MVEAVAPLPVLAAGGIGSGQQIMAAMSVGVEGVWLGSMWLNSTESHAEPAQRGRLLRVAARHDHHDRAVLRPLQAHRRRAAAPAHPEPAAGDLACVSDQGTPLAWACRERERERERYVVRASASASAFPIVRVRACATARRPPRRAQTKRRANGVRRKRGRRRRARSRPPPGLAAR